MSRVQVTDECRTAADVWARVKARNLFRTRFWSRPAATEAKPEPPRVANSPPVKAPANPDPMEDHAVIIINASRRWIARHQLEVFQMRPTAAPRIPMVEEIQHAVAHHFKVERIDLLSARRTANVVRPRQIAMYLARLLTTRSTPEIGRRFGGKDHTTVLHAFRKIEAERERNAELAHEIAAIKETIELAIERMRLSTKSSTES